MAGLCDVSHLSYLLSFHRICLADRKETVASKRTLRNVMKRPNNNPYLSNPSWFLINSSVIFFFETSTADSKISAANAKWFWYVIRLVSCLNVSVIQVNTQEWRFINNILGSTNNFQTDFQERTHLYLLVCKEIKMMPSGPQIPHFKTTHRAQRGGPSRARIWHYTKKHIKKASCSLLLLWHHGPNENVCGQEM